MDEFALQAFFDLPAGDEFAFASGEGGVVDLEGHAHGRLVHGEVRQGFDVVRVAEGIGDVERVDAGEGDDVAGGSAINFDFFQSEEFVDLQDAAVTHVAVAANDFDLGIAADAAALDATDADDAGVAGVVERGDLHAEGFVAFDLRRFDVVDDGFEERRHVAAADVGVVAGVAIQAGGVDDGEVELFVGGAEAVEEVEGFVQHPVGPRTGAVDFVDNDDGVQPHVEGFLGDEAGLRHGAVHGIHQEEDAVHHGEDALDFTPEVGVSGGIYDVDLVVFPADSGVFRHDGDAAFAFEVHGVHHAFVDFGALSKGVGLAEELVNEGGFAVVNVGDDGDVADFVYVLDISHGVLGWFVFLLHKERRWCGVFLGWQL